MGWGRGELLDRGAADVVGNILMVGVTVIFTGALAAVILSAPPPVDTPHADLVVGLETGASGWGTGDESVTLRHTGGQPIASSATTIQIDVGGSVTSLTGASLGGAFADGALTLGETWTRTMSISPATPVSVNVFSTGTSGSGTIALNAVTTDCRGELVAPTAVVTKGVANVTSATSGAVSVTAVLSDNCAGVDPLSPLRIFYRLNDGTNPAYTQGALMTRTATNTWTGSIPDLTYGTAAGKTLQFYVSPMKDLVANSGTSATTSDLVDAVTLYTFVNTVTPTFGTVTNVAAMQSASDSGASGRIDEGLTSGAPATSTYSANAVVSAGGWSSASSGYVSDDVRATTTGTTDTVKYGFADPVGGSGAILSVKLLAEVSITSWSNDGFSLQACLGATCSSASSQLNGAASDVTIEYNVTTLRPGGGSWTWTDITNLESAIRSEKFASVDGTWRIDRAWVEVRYASQTYSMNAEARFVNVPAGATQVLELRYSTSADTFAAQVWDGSAWTTRTTLSSGSLTTWTYTLTSAEYAGGAPKVRFVDSTPSGTAQGTLTIDYARVKTN